MHADFPWPWWLRYDVCVEQKLSGSHKVLVEMQDDVLELMKSAVKEYPASKVKLDELFLSTNPVKKMPSFAFQFLSNIFAFRSTSVKSREFWIPPKATCSTWLLWWTVGVCIWWVPVGRKYSKSLGACSYRAVVWKAGIWCTAKGQNIENQVGPNCIFCKETRGCIKCSAKSLSSIFVPLMICFAPVGCCCARMHKQDSFVAQH